MPSNTCLGIEFTANFYIERTYGINFYVLREILKTINNKIGFAL